MAIRFACPGCNKNYSAPDEAAGMRTTCPACQAALDVPAAAIPVAAFASPPPVATFAAPPPPLVAPEAATTPPPIKTEDRRIYCDRCADLVETVRKNKTNTTSVALMVGGIFFCPLFFVGILTCSKIEVCARCGDTLRDHGLGVGW